MKKLFLVLLFVSFINCSKDDDDSISANALNNYQLDLISYFKSIALGFENGGVSEITRRWETDLNIFIGGSPSDELLSELERIKSEINNLTSTDFAINIVNDSLTSNYYIFFGKGQEYANIFRLQSSAVENTWGLFNVFWNGLNQINYGHSYVNIVEPNLQQQKHTLREELTQSLGLGKDSYLYNDSVFHQQLNIATEYSQIDRDLIRLLYHPEMEIGLNSIQVEQRLTNILLKENELNSL